MQKKNKKLIEKPNNMAALQSRLISKKIKNKDLLSNIISFQERFEKNDKLKKYILNRNFQDYNFIFKRIITSSALENSSVFKRDIISMLSAIERKYKKKEINVLDDGAGKGFFLSELKEKWDFLKKERLVSSELKTTAVSLTNTISKKNIDFKHIGNVIDFMPERKYDMILSVYGGFHYTQRPLQREVLLKYLYSLNKGGIGIFSFKTKLLKDYMNEQNRTQVIRGLEKRGFRAEFVYIPIENRTRVPDLPDVYLFVERVK